MGVRHNQKSPFDVRLDGNGLFFVLYKVYENMLKSA